jgi:hypothetical protein
MEFFISMMGIWLSLMLSVVIFNSEGGSEIISVLYSRHVKPRVPRGPYGSHLCCHEGNTRQLIEVI